MAGAALDLSAGEQLIDPVYIDDVVEAFLLAGRRLMSGTPVAKEEYAVSSSRPVSLREFVAAYATVAGHKLDLRWGTRPYRTREVMVPWNAGAPLPGWQPKISLEQGMRRVAGCGPPGEVE